VRDALLRWAPDRATFDGFHGEDTLIGRAAARWERYGVVSVALRLGRSDATIDTVRRYRLDPEWKDPLPRAAPSRESRRPALQRRFRVTRPGAFPAPGERLVECVQDDWGREWAVVLARAVRVP
jgi:hypothetical protein